MTRTTTLLTAAALLTGCADRPHPTAVDPGEAVVEAGESVLTTAAVALSATQFLSAQIPVEDALTRVLPVLAEGKAMDELGRALADLTAALDAEDSCAIRTSRRAAEEALRYAGKHAPEEYEADLEVVQLALESIEQTGRGRCER